MGGREGGRESVRGGGEHTPHPHTLPLPRVLQQWLKGKVVAFICMYVSALCMCFCLLVYRSVKLLYQTF